jgi:argininosuccinate synthase
MPERILLAYSGGSVTTAAIGWLKAAHHAEVIAVILDLGQGGDLEAVRDLALAHGAVRAHVLDVRDEFARHFVVRALKADALYEDRYPLESALTWPLVASKLRDIAEIEHAASVAHGGLAVAGALSPLDVTIRAVCPRLSVRALPPGERSSAPVVNGSLWGRSIGFPVTDEPWEEPPEDLYTLTRSGGECPNEPAYVELSFERGVAVAINGVAMPLVDLIASLTTIAGAHGVGRQDLVENRADGRFRKVFEAPAAIALHTAHRELTKVVAGRDLDRFNRQVRVKYADLICHGLWFTPFREALDAFVDKVQEQVTGDVRLKLFKGTCRTTGRKPAQPSPMSTQLPDESRASPSTDAQTGVELTTDD